MKTTSLNKSLFFSKTSQYLNVYLPRQAGKSARTIKTYADALTVFRRYLYEERGISIRSFKFEDCSRDLLLEYLEYLKKDHKAVMCHMTEVAAALIWEKDRFLACQHPAHKARSLL